MEGWASRLADFAQDRLGHGLRAVGYHSEGRVDVTFIRADIVERYPPESIEQFVRISRSLPADLQSLDEGMGSPEASLHLLDGGLIIRFHYPGDGVVFLSIDRDVGRNFTHFIRECKDRME